MMTKPSTHKFTPLDILNRAGEFGITIELDGNNLVVTVPFSLHTSTKDKALESIKANKPEIIEYLCSLESVPLCSACLNEDIETSCTLVGPDNVMYCEAHYRTLPDEWHKAETERLAEAYRTAFPEWRIEVLSTGEWERRKPKQQPVIMCQAVWHLNEKGKPARAREKVASREVCGCTTWVASDDGYFCAKCYSPQVST